MKNITFYKLLILFLTLSLASCSKKDDITTAGTNTEAQNINKFILDNMTEWYLWSDNIPDDLDIKSTENSIEFFEKTRYRGNIGEYDSNSDTYKNGDPWSFITDDLQGLLDYFNGVRTSKGFYLYPYGLNDGTDNWALVVAYVYANSPASNAGLKRGSIFIKIDGKDINNSNVNELLNQESFEITMGEFNFDDEKFYLSDTKNTLTSEVIETNPILRSDVYEINGTKIAYLMYNSFIHGYDKDVIEQFESYKAQGVTELVLDFRYNGGGSVASAMNIASMIAPKSAIGKVFLKKMYNNKMQDYISTNPDNYSNLGPEALYDNLTSEAYYYDNEDPVKDIILPNLDLNRVYVIGLSGTASASELVINGLKPYMKVSTIGKQTHGKYVASITLENKTYKNWAIQPIVFKSANADDETDYWNGFAPDIDMVDHPIIGDFGYNKTYGGFEPLLAAAINDILGVSSKKQQYPEVAKPVGNIEVSDRLSKTMIYDIK